MIRATRVIPAGELSREPRDIVTLDHDRRHRRRLAMTCAGGLAFLLDLPEATPLRDGDGLELEDGRIVKVVAAGEPLAEIATPDAHTLVRVAWHLGNRHLPCQLLGDRIRIRRDHVIEGMVTRLGATVTAIEAPFDPESGAYHSGHGHHHHGHDHDSDHRHHNAALDHDDRIDEEEPARG
jgi:urease accessory protein